jgi:hypothetical protein
MRGAPQSGLARLIRRIEDSWPNSVKPHPEEPVGGEEPKLTRALPPQDGHLMSQGTSSSSSEARLRTRNESSETRAERIVIMPTTTVRRWRENF